MTDQSLRAVKPLGRKAYGSIGHLPGSRLGPGDHHVHPGQEFICTKGAKWVRPDKVDGKYLVGTAGYVGDGEDVWNWRPGVSR